MIKTFFRWVVVAGCIASTIKAAPLPDGWSSAGVGAISPAGTQSYAPETARFDLAGAGADIWGAADQFHYVYESWTGEGEWVVQVASLQNTNAWAKAGIMVRENLAVGSPHASLVLTPGNGVAFQRRKVAGGFSLNTNLAGSTTPGWLKLVRKGNQFDTYISSDGIHWTYWVTDVVTMPSSVFVGLVVTSHHTGVLASAAFTQFVGTTPLPSDFPSGWMSQDIGSPALSGSADFQSDEGLLTVRGAGTDIWGAADQFQFVSQPWIGDAVVIARVDSLRNTNAWAKTGVMIRANSAAGSCNALVAITPGNGVTFQYRTTTGGSSAYTAVAGVTAPGWVKLERWGDRFDGFYSGDGLTWRYIGSATIAMAADVELGVAATSHNPGALAEVVFSHFDYHTTGAPGGLWGEYFSGKTFNTPVLQRLDGLVSFIWGSAAPASGVPADSFSVRWSGSVVPDVTQNYTFSTVSDDGVRLWVNGQLLIDNWTNHGAVENSGALSLTAGTAYSLKMEYYENTGSATARLLWTAADRAKAPIAAVYLKPSQYPDTDADGIPDYWEKLHGLDQSNPADAHTVDSEGNGLTYLQEYLIATHPDSPDTDGDGVPDIADPFPLDYYNGDTPMVTVIGGDQQSALVATFNANAFDIAVWRSDGSGPLVDAPVSFSVTSGGGLLSQAMSSTLLNSSLSLRTDVDGTVQASYQQPAAAGVTSQITVTAGAASTTLTTTSLAESTPFNLTAETVSLTQVLLSWSGDVNGTSYIIERQTGDGGYETVSVVDGALYFLDTNLIEGQSYLYRIKALSGGVETEYCSVLAVVAGNAPIAVTLLLAPTTGGSVLFTAEVSNAQIPVTKVEFYVDSDKVSESTVAPYVHTWTSQDSATHTVQARAYHANGLSVVSETMRYRTPAFSADFEPVEGYVAGSLAGQQSWEIYGGAVEVTDTDSASGAYGVRIDHSESTGMDTVLATDPAETVVYVDFYAKPSVAEGEDTTGFWSNSYWIQFRQTGANAEIYVYDGDFSVGSGGWRSTGFTVPLNAEGTQTANWCRITIRQDFDAQRWDLYLDGRLVAADVQSNDSIVDALSILGVDSSTVEDSYFDCLHVGYENSLFEDADKDGMDDVWERKNGLDATTNDRELDPDGDGLSSIEEYLYGSNPHNADTDGDGIRDGWEVRHGLNPANVSDAGLPYAGSTMTNATAYNAWLQVLPSVPLNLQPTPLPAGSIQLTWDAASPPADGSIVGYEVYLNGNKVGTTSNLQFTVPFDPSSDLLYFYSVKTLGDSGTTSNAGNEVLIQPAPVSPYCELIPVSSKEAWTSKVSVPGAFPGTFYLNSQYHLHENKDRFNTLYGTDQVSHFDNDLIMTQSIDPVTAKLNQTVTGEVNSWGVQQYDSYYPHAEWQSGTSEADLLNYAKLVPDYSHHIVRFPGNTYIDSTDDYNNRKIEWDYSGQEGAPWWIANEYSGVEEILFSNEYTDEMLLANATAAFAVAPLNTDFHDGTGELAIYNVLKSIHNLAYSIDLKETTFRLKDVGATGSRHIRSVEYFQPQVGTVGTAQVVATHDVMTSWSGDGWYTPDQIILPPIAQGTVQFQQLVDPPVKITTPAMTPTADDLRLYQTNALFTGEVASISFEGATVNGQAEAILRLSGDLDKVKLIAVDPAVLASQGLAAALAQGVEIHDNENLLTDPLNPGLVGGWTLLAVGSTPGALTISLQQTVQGVPVATTKVVKVYPQIELAVDANRDGQIKLATEDASDATSASTPYRFWSNDDDDTGDEADQGLLNGNSDEPGKLSGFWELDGRTPDHAHAGVDGRCDLIDFFPVYLDIKQLLAVLPTTTAGIEYKLKQADAALNFVYTDLTRDHAFDYLTKEAATYGANFDKLPHMAETAAITADGVVLSTTFLGKIKNGTDKGVILVEGVKPSDKPLRLVVVKAGVEIAEVALNIKISEVEKMYRWVNLRGSLGSFSQSVTRQTDTSEPANYPDARTNGKMFIWVHGYNVNEQQSRAWAAEGFKRLFQSGSRTMYTFVSWHGDHSQIPFVGISPDYWDNITNAFRTSALLPGVVAALPGTSKIITGHSMGNVLVGSAIVDHGLNVTKYFMLDAAMPLEAYDTSTQNIPCMRRNEWASYDSRLWSTEWHQLFPSDGRAGLTWKNCFGDIPNAINFYSSGEEVLNNNDVASGGNPGEVPAIGSERAWVGQEMIKGTYHIGAVFTFDIQGGWGFNSAWDIVETTTTGGPHGGTTTTYRHRTPAEAATLTDDQLKAEPFFHTFQDDRLMTSGGSAAASEYITRADALGGAIPALSFPAGRNPIPLFDQQDRNIDLMDLQDGWPQARLDNVKKRKTLTIGRWFHSDAKNIAYRYNYKLWDTWVGIGGLK